MSETMTAQAREFAELFATLMPPESVEVIDIAGGKHRLRANLPAAVEAGILQALDGLRFPELADLVPTLQAGATSDKLAALISALSRVASNEDVLDVVSACFERAHPRAVRMAEENVRADEDAAQYLPDSGRVRAFHLFSVSDIVAGIVPFAMRGSSRIGSMVASLLPSTS